MYKIYWNEYVRQIVDLKSPFGRAVLERAYKLGKTIKRL